jgi:hypothetical protein
MNTKKLVTIIISLALIFTFTPVISFADGYKAVGTGEKRPENYVRTREYSRYRKICESFEDYTLNGVLTDRKLESEINKWVADTIESTGLTGVFYTAINGYLDVTVGMWTGEIVFTRIEAQNSVWNLKTGERITKFSDLFYEGTDFVPAVKKAVGHSLDEEPKVFSAAALTQVWFAFDFDAYGGSDISAPLYSMMPAVWDYSPVWNFYDMSEHFTSNSNQIYTADEFSEDISITDRLCITEIVSPLFLSEEEVEIRNSELQKLYDIILESDEYKNYVQPPMGDPDIPFYRFEQENYNHYDYPRDLDYREDKGYYVRHFYYHSSDDYVEPIKTRVSFPDNAAKTLIDTPFGVYYSVRETGEIFTPSTHKVLSVNEDFAGLVDIDSDGSAEIITVDKVIRVYDENMNLRMTVPLKFDNYGLLTAWKVTGNNSGEIYYICNSHPYDSYGVIKYELVTGGIMNITEETQKTGTLKSDYFIEDGKTVIYMGNMLCRDDTDLYDGKAAADFELMQSQIGKLSDAKRYVIISDYQGGQAQNIAVSTEIEAERHTYKLFDGDTDITPEMFFVNSVQVSVKNIRYFTYDPSAFIVISSTSQLPRPIAGKITENGFEEYPISQSLYNLHFTDYHEWELVGTTSEYQDGIKYWMDYWFRYSGGEITEYGGIDMPEENFRKFSGSSDVYKEIGAKKGEVTNIIYRGNSIINVNYRMPTDQKGFYTKAHLTFRLEKTDMGYKLEYVETENFSGEIAKAMFEELAHYPYSLPE